MSSEPSRNRRKENDVMKYRTGTKLIVVLAVIGALAVAAAAAASRTTSDTTTTTANEIRAAEGVRLRAEVAGDTVKAGQLLAPDFQQIDVLGLAGGRSDYLANVGGAVDFIKLVPTSAIKVRVYGNAAVARFQEAFEVVAGPDRVKHLGWTTDLFERRHGRWQLVWSQTTATPNDPALFVQALKPKP
jgi:hypothetical protein